ncbi:MAG: hypothetical protein Q9173_000803 [Seirophora scorigena]
MAIGHATGTMTELYKKAQSRIPATMSLPSHWLKSYEDFVTRNASSVTQIESALRSLTYIVPGRFRESELASETRKHFRWHPLPHIYPPSLPLSHLPPSPTLSLYLPSTAADALHGLLYRPLAPLLQLGHPPPNDPIHRTAM